MNNLRERIWDVPGSAHIHMDELLKVIREYAVETARRAGWPGDNQVESQRDLILTALERME